MALLLLSGNTKTFLKKYEEAIEEITQAIIFMPNFKKSIARVLEKRKDIFV